MDCNYIEYIRRNYAYEDHLRGTSSENHQKLPIIFFETNKYICQLSVLEALGFWSYCVEIMNVGENKKITTLIDLTSSRL